MGHSEGETPAVVICCPGCRYELTGLPAGVCPECGRGFHPSDPKTVWDVRARRKATKRRRVRIGIALLACLVVFQLAMFTVIPRPAMSAHGGVQWGLWVWLGQGYGVQREQLLTETLLVHRWGKTVSRIDAEERWAAGTPRKLWSLARVGPDRWRLETIDPTVTSQTLLLAFNTMRTDEELFGVRITDSARTEAECTFSVEGTRALVLSEMIRVYGLSIEPGVTSATDTDVWVIDPETGKLTEVSVAEAASMGVAVAPYQTDAVVRIEVMPDTGIVAGAADMLREWREELGATGTGGAAGPGHP